MKILILKYVSECQLLMGQKGSSWVNKENQRRMEKLLRFNFFQYLSDRSDQHGICPQLGWILSDIWLPNKKKKNVPIHWAHSEQLHKITRNWQSFSQHYLKQKKFRKGCVFSRAFMCLRYPEHLSSLIWLSCIIRFCNYLNSISNMNLQNRKSLLQSCLLCCLICGVCSQHITLRSAEKSMKHFHLSGSMESWSSYKTYILYLGSIFSKLLDYRLYWKTFTFHTSFWCWSHGQPKPQWQWGLDLIL